MHYPPRPIPHSSKANTRIISTVKDWFFPRFCIACGAEGTLLCAPCQKRISNREDTDRCAVCGIAGRDGLCVACRRRLKLRGLIKIGAFRGALRELLHHLKYEDLRDGREVLGEMLAHRWRQSGGAGGVVIPVPLSRTRLRERGYNQSEVIARSFINFTKLPTLNALARRKDTQKQTTLSRQDRFANLEGAFVSLFDFRKYRGNIYLLDDVLTTGATLAQAAAALRRASAKNIYGIVVAAG